MWAVVLSLLLLLFPASVQATYDPLSVPNNKFGIHIADLNDITDVPPLVNSNGGDWGYVTLVATDRDRERERWQEMFNRMRRLHLIPIVRLATYTQSGNWAKPDPAKFDEVVSFLNSLNWPIQNRYIILYNEPNHAGEWGGLLDPEGYANIFVELAKKLKTASEDFFILPAGLDVSAASDGRSMDAGEYWKRMIKTQPELLTHIDGWTSHSYPNPGFSGSPYAIGRGTLRSYEWELGYMRSLGLTKNLPVFITETGWVHNQGKIPRFDGLSPEAVGINLKSAGSGAWTDSRIVAVTPFVFNYQDIPFDTFSWKKLGKNEFYPQYDAYKEIAKSKGIPRQREEYVLSEPLLPSTLVTGSAYTLSAQLINKGQGILNQNDGYSLSLDDSKGGFIFVADNVPTLEPDEKGIVTIHLKTPTLPGIYRLSLAARHGESNIAIQTRSIDIVPPPSLVISVPLGWRRDGDANDVTVLVYDHNTLLQKFTGLTVANGKARVTGLTNIVPGRSYRVVLLVPYYLPRQTILPLSSKETSVRMKRLLPLDIDRDGKLSLTDLWTILTKPPNNMVGLFVGP